MKELNLITIIAVALLLSSCSEPVEDATSNALTLTSQQTVEYPGPPTAVNLLLKKESDGFVVFRSYVKRGSIMAPLIAENMAEIVNGKTLLFRFAGISRAGERLFEGEFLLPLSLRSEYLDSEERYKILRLSEAHGEQIVSVKLPFDMELATVEFFQLIPDAKLPVEKWGRVSFGRISLNLKPGREVDDANVN